MALVWVPELRLPAPARHVFQARLDRPVPALASDGWARVALDVTDLDSAGGHQLELPGRFSPDVMGWWLVAGAACCIVGAGPPQPQLRLARNQAPAGIAAPIPSSGHAAVAAVLVWLDGVTDYIELQVRGPVVQLTGSILTAVFEREGVPPITDT